MQTLQCFANLYKAPFERSFQVNYIRNEQGSPVIVFTELQLQFAWYLCVPTYRGISLFRLNSTALSWRRKNILWNSASSLVSISSYLVITRSTCCKTTLISIYGLCWYTEKWCVGPRNISLTSKHIRKLGEHIRWWRQRAADAVAFSLKVSMYYVGKRFSEQCNWILTFHATSLTISAQPAEWHHRRF